MKKPNTRPRNAAAKALRQELFRQRIVKAKHSYSRKVKHSKRDVHQEEHPFFYAA